MIKFQEAESIVIKRLKRLRRPSEEEIVIAHHEEYDFGWIFTYNYKSFVDNREAIARGEYHPGGNMIVGASSIVVDRYDGSMTDMPFS
ncbi:MAG: hypothetical protein AAF740_12415, partial [Bacteroidota bacterium]